LTAPVRGLTLAEARALGQGSTHLDADPTYARVLVRKISPYVSWLIATRTPLSADAVTAASIISGTVGGLLCAAGTPVTALIAVVLLQFAYLLDVADGEVARIRRTAGLRGTYLDLIGHFIQNRALYLGAGWTLITGSGYAAWAIVAVALVMGFSVPFGYYARLHVTQGAGGPQQHPEHATRTRMASRPALTDPALVKWLYARVAFIWNYPASMNVFSLALLVDVARGAVGQPEPLAVPAVIAAFGATLALKQVIHAIRLLRREAWAPA
jgi:phosphatidylglycerophosphate synthase